MSNENEDEREFLKNKMLELEKQFEIMEKKMDRILELLETDCKKMSDHINFVENVYDNVKTPFYYVMDKVKYLVSGDNININNNNNNILLENEKREDNEEDNISQTLK